MKMDRQSSTAYLFRSNATRLELAAVVVFAAVLLIWNGATRSNLPFVVWSLGSVLIVLRLSRFDSLHPLAAFLFPWLTVSVFAQLELSRFARPLTGKTYATIWGLELAAIISSYLLTQRPPGRGKAPELTAFRPSRVTLLFILYSGLTVLNVALAGYVPLVSGVATGDTGYLDFGLHGIYGFYNAFANSLGVLCFFLFCKTGRKLYLLACLLIGAVFVLFVSRQNVVSMLVQCGVIYSFVKGRIGRTKLIVAVTVVLVLFSIAGNLRSGDVKQIAGIKDEYQNVPGALIWVYAYSYFNIVNLDNVVTSPGVPVYDGSSLFSLLPTFMRPEISHIEQEIELSQFNAYSYVAPVYADLGLAGTVLFTVLVTAWAIRSYQRALVERSFYLIAKYSVLFFCALFSFFVNFWLYLPVISEIPILAGMSWFVFSTVRETFPVQVTLRPVTS